MKISKKVSILLASVLCSSVLTAGEKVSLATDGTGDFLLAPFYEAKKDICSEIKVFNTNETDSILAKVSIREQISSQEVDLPIFLSPGDVWSGKICETYGKILLTSNDDSNHPAAKDILAVGKDLNAQSISAGHENVDFSRGYIEIYPIAQFKEGSTNKVQKDILVKRWDALANGDMSNPKLRKNGVDGNSLSGITSYKTNNKETASMNMTAFEGTHSKQKTGASIRYSEDTSPSILLGQSEKKQILELLQNSTTSFTYDNYGKEQFVYLTFPFGYTHNQERVFKLTVRDMQENKEVEKEVIFSPRVSKKQYSIKNELAVIPVNELIELTNNAGKFKEGMIQIKEIRNRSNHQLGQGQYASFLPTLVSTMQGNETFINTAVSAPVK
ncbi:MAG: hypothetical protein ACERKK_01275 [Poseidonibacter sp.]|uniref:hypothetical protein n=1 Tax=Poseidonibacter sp. TaxID=2321188 RepID=UPI00359EBF3B